MWLLLYVFVFIKFMKNGNIRVAWELLGTAMILVHASEVYQTPKWQVLCKNQTWARCGCACLPRCTWRPAEKKKRKKRIMERHLASSLWPTLYITVCLLKETCGFKNQLPLHKRELQCRNSFLSSFLILLELGGFSSRWVSREVEWAGKAMRVIHLIKAKTEGHKSPNWLSTQSR